MTPAQVQHFRRARDTQLGEAQAELAHVALQLAAWGWLSDQLGEARPMVVAALHAKAAAAAVREARQAVTA